MAVLAKAEAAYLDLLRVVILAIATLAMILAFGGLVIGGWLYISTLGSHPHAPPVEHVALEDYISEQRDALTPQGGAVADTSSGSQAQVIVVRAAIRPAYNDFISYVTGRMNGTLNKASFADSLNSSYDAFDNQYKPSYATSLNSVAHQLTISKGRPLSSDQFGNLLTWHDKKFSDAVAAEIANKAEKKQAGIQLAAIGSVSFLAFLLLVFCFIFVKIERNLRVMRTLTTVVER